VFQLANVGSTFCLDQNPNGDIEHLAQRSCFPNAPNDPIAQTWNELDCPLTGCNTNSTQPTFIAPPPSFTPSITSIPVLTSAAPTTTTIITTIPTTTGSSDTDFVSVSVLGGVVSAAVVIGIAAGVGGVICLRRSHRRNAAQKDLEGKGGNVTDISNYEARNSKTADNSFVLSAIHYNKPEEPQAETRLVEKVLIEKPLTDKLLVDNPLIEESLVEESLVEESLHKKPQVEESLVEVPLVEESLEEEPLVQESLVEERLVGGSLVGESLVEERLVGGSLVGESLVEEPLIKEAELARNNR